jgi:SAM-dependent methyltransferase
LQSQSFNTLVAQFLGSRLPERLAAQINLAALPIETQSFIRRMLILMQRAGFPATDITPLLLRVLTFFVPHALAVSQDGKVPPITLPGRHQRLDILLAERTETAAAREQTPLFLDLGCGFPPVTTIETAKRFAPWDIIGVDRHFPPFLVTDRDGHYACFDAQGDCIHVQTRISAHGRRLNADPVATRDRFVARFAELRGLLPKDGDADRPATVANAAGDKLVRHHIRNLETDKLRFLEAGIEDLDLPPARAIRCMNVLLYFPADQRQSLLATMGRYLAADGHLIVGFNHYLGSGARYRVYRKGAENVISKAFAFSLDNLRPLGIAPWYTLQPDDEDAALLADISATLRNDAAFWPGFNRRVDASLAQEGICRRAEDGFLRFPAQPPTPDAMIRALMAVWGRLATDGVAAEAVQALRRAGHRAWINAAGDIAILPPGKEPP